MQIFLEIWRVAKGAATHRLRTTGLTALPWKYITKGKQQWWEPRWKYKSSWRLTWSLIFFRVCGQNPSIRCCPITWLQTDSVLSWILTQFIKITNLWTTILRPKTALPRPWDPGNRGPFRHHCLLTGKVGKTDQTCPCSVYRRLSLLTLKKTNQNIHKIESYITLQGNRGEA